MKKHVYVEQMVEVEIDESKFDETFLAEFRESFYNFTTIEEHIEHLGQMYARGIADACSFIEGYGEPSEMGIKFKTKWGDQSISMDI